VSLPVLPWSGTRHQSRLDTGNDPAGSRRYPTRSNRGRNGVEGVEGPRNMFEAGLCDFPRALTLVIDRGQRGHPYRAAPVA
jgi:hypothetical protein